MPPGTITALRAQVHDSQRISVFIDEQFAIGISLNTLAEERLFVGQELDAEAWVRLEQREASDQARHAALRLIERRPRSVREVQDRLRAKGFDAAAITYATERLMAVGMLDDAAFCRYWIENRLAHRPRGRKALQYELRRKGVSRSLIEEALSALNEAPDAEYERALELGRSVLQRYIADPAPIFRRRLGGFLQRRGFGVDVVVAVLEQLATERETPNDEHDHL